MSHITRFVFFAGNLDCRFNDSRSLTRYTSFFINPFCIFNAAIYLYHASI